jgi:hypothetical protein
MEGIETADAILSNVYPKSDFEKKDKIKKGQVKIDIRRLRMDKVEELLIPAHPISLMINYSKKL